MTAAVRVRVIPVRPARAGVPGVRAAVEAVLAVVEGVRAVVEGARADPLRADGTTGASRSMSAVSGRSLERPARGTGVAADEARAGFPL
jgi:hypothetical protein